MDKYFCSVNNSDGVRAQSNDYSKEVVKRKREESAEIQYISIGQNR
jgi:hypothetical protein